MPRDPEWGFGGKIGCMVDGVGSPGCEVVGCPSDVGFVRVLSIVSRWHHIQWRKTLSCETMALRLKERRLESPSVLLDCDAIGHQLSMRWNLLIEVGGSLAIAWHVICWWRSKGMH